MRQVRNDDDREHHGVGPGFDEDALVGRHARRAGPEREAHGEEVEGEAEERSPVAAQRGAGVGGGRGRLRGCGLAAASAQQAQQDRGGEGGCGHGDSAKHRDVQGIQHVPEQGRAQQRRGHGRQERDEAVVPEPFQGNGHQGGGACGHERRSGQRQGRQGERVGGDQVQAGERRRPAGEQYGRHERRRRPAKHGLRSAGAQRQHSSRKGERGEQGDGEDRGRPLRLRRRHEGVLGAQIEERRQQRARKRRASFQPLFRFLAHASSLASLYRCAADARPRNGRVARLPDTSVGA